MGANVFNKFTMIEIERRLKYHKEKARSRNSDAAMIANVKRNLFGTRAGENKNQIQHEMAVIAQHDIKRWNFDFNKEKPIYTDAQFDWKFSYETKEAQLRQTKITGGFYLFFFIVSMYYLSYPEIEINYLSQLTTICNFMIPIIFTMVKHC